MPKKVLEKPEAEKTAVKKAEPVVKPAEKAENTTKPQGVEKAEAPAAVKPAENKVQNVQASQTPQKAPEERRQKTAGGDRMFNDRQGDRANRQGDRTGRQSDRTGRQSDHSGDRGGRQGDRQNRSFDRNGERGTGRPPESFL